MQSKLASWCSGLIEAGVIAAIIVAPLFFNIHSDRVFEPDKLTLVRSIAVLMAGAWLAAFIASQGWQDLSWLRWRSDGSVWRTPFVLPIALLLLVYLLATVFSVAPRTSWAGSYQRLQGTYTTLSYIVIFALAAHTLRTREQVNRIVTTVIVTSIPVSLYGLLQHYGLDPLPWAGNVQARIAGHMGNAIFIAAYLIMAVPLTAVRIVDGFTNILSDEALSYADVVRSSVYIFTIAIQLAAIYWSGSRGPLFGLLVGMFALVLILLVSLRNAVSGQARFRPGDFGRALALVLLGILAAGGAIFLLLQLLTSAGRFTALAGAAGSLVALLGSLGVVAVVIFVMLVSRRGWHWLWLSWLLLAVAAMVLLGVFNLTPEPVTGASTARFGETVQAWREIPLVGRFGRLLEAEGGTGRVRVLIWEGALELITPHEPLVYPDGQEDRLNFLRPLIGYGPESMYVVYNRFYVPELATIEARNASPDRSHNETFDALIITGLAGFLVWQALYFSVFYYGFQWLGVVRTRRDRNLLIALWVGGALVGALSIMQLLGAVYIGVAIPFGSIAGLAIYLVYYALSGSAGPDTGHEIDPFNVERLLMMGLLAAVVAHYVEIHFGIAIAATRVHFFVYVALMLLVGYVIPGSPAQAEEVAPAAGKARRRGRQRAGWAQVGWVGPVLGATFALSLICATLFYEFMNYTQRPDVTIETIEDVPGALDIIYQAYFIHPAQGFIQSPFVFLMITLTWALGTLAYISELARQGLFSPSTAARRRAARSDHQVAAALFFGLAVIAFAARFLQQSAAQASSTQVLGQSLVLLWGALCLIAAILLLRRQQHAETIAGYIAALGLALSLPVMVAGAGLVGLTMLLGCGAAVYLLWDGPWTAYALPALIIAVASMLSGLAVAYLHASQIRSVVFFGPSQTLPDVQRLIATADRFTGFITLFYIVLIALLLIAPFGLAYPRWSSSRQGAAPVAYAALAAILLLGLFLVRTSNLRVIQADVIYKQGRPLDNQASRANDPDAWNAPIILYERAIELAPLEDFYYLFLGRAYLERSSLSADPAVQQQLLRTANDRLLEAQRINPLNTDHTANLARLATRWTAVSSGDEARRAQLLEQAKEYYQSALALSPQNSVIRNEYGNLQATLDNDCDGAIATLEQSRQVDPFYVQTYYALASVFEFCAGQSEQPQEDYYRQGAEVLAASLAQSDANAGAVYMQMAQLYRQAGDFERALAALDEAQSTANGPIPPYLADYQRARVYDSMGQAQRARELAETALESAPLESQEEIRTFLAGLETP